MDEKYEDDDDEMGQMVSSPTINDMSGGEGCCDLTARFLVSPSTLLRSRTWAYSGRCKVEMGHPLFQYVTHYLSILTTLISWQLWHLP